MSRAEAAAVATSASVPSKAAARKASRVAAPPPKVTEAELARLHEEERLRLEREAGAAKKRAARMAEEYERVVLVANTNRDGSLIEARSVEEAIARMSVVDPQAVLPADKHPERRLKSSFKDACQFTRVSQFRVKFNTKQLAKLVLSWLWRNYNVLECISILIPCSNSIKGAFMLFVLDLKAQSVSILDPIPIDSSFRK